MIAEMASAFAIGQPIGGDGGFSRPLAAAALVLGASA
jgi:hypothetical protein